MERCVALFISRRKGFFREEACIDCSIDEYCACDGADVLFDVDSVMRQRLINLGDGVKISEPIKVDRKLLTGNNINVSLSHKGILAICLDQHTLQFTDLNNSRQVEMRVEFESLIGFYDCKILLLTLLKPLREATVEKVFDNPTLKTFEIIKRTKYPWPTADVSLLHKRRILYYRTRNYKLFSFNVDTRENIKINVRRNVDYIISVTGISCDVKTVFQDYDNRHTYTLNNDNLLIEVSGEVGYGEVTTLLSSTSNPKDIENAVFKYRCELIKDENEIDTSSQIMFKGEYSVVRVYRDIFLAYDWIAKWILLRIIVS